MKLLVTHTDLDGLGNIVVADYFNLGFDKVISTNYGDRGEHDTLIAMNGNDSVTYTDFTPDEEAMKIIAERGICSEIYDHHESVENLMKKFEDEHSSFVRYFYDNSICGTKIFFNNLCIRCKNVVISESLTEFVDLVDTYDMWKNDSDLWEKAQNLNRLVFKTAMWSASTNVEKYKFFTNGALWKCRNMTHYNFNDFENRKINEDIKVEDDIFSEYVCKKREIKTRKDSKGNYFSVIRLNKKISIICNRLLDKYKGLSYIICINTFDENNPKISIRSRDDFSVLSLEGVKGHKCAGAVEKVDSVLCENLWKNRFNFKRID